MNNTQQQKREREREKRKERRSTDTQKIFRLSKKMIRNILSVKLKKEKKQLNERKRPNDVVLFCDPQKYI